MQLATRFVRLVCFCFFVTTANHAYALVSGSVFYGGASLKSDFTKSSSVSGSSLKLLLELDPIPFIPVGLGANVTTVGLDKGHFSSLPMTKASLGLTEFTLSAWLPMIPILTPYLRVGYVLEGSLTQDYEASIGTLGSAFKNDVTGMDYTLGMKYRLFPFVNFLLEGQQGSYKAKNVFGTDQDFTLTTISVGLEVGI